MPKVTIVPDDSLIIVDGEGLQFEYTSPEGLHALQWSGEGGHTEWGDGHNEEMTSEDYETQVAPYVTLWEAEKARLEQEAAEAEAAYLETYNSEEARFKRLRAERDSRLDATDYLLMADYPISDEDKAVVVTYRQALRDLPSLDGAPWDGGGDETPWPEYPL